jgi:hypothetical protein
MEYVPVTVLFFVKRFLTFRPVSKAFVSPQILGSIHFNTLLYTAVNLCQRFAHIFTVNGRVGFKQMHTVATTLAPLTDGKDDRSTRALSHARQ